MQCTLSERTWFAQTFPKYYYLKGFFMIVGSPNIPQYIHSEHEEKTNYAQLKNIIYSTKSKVF